MIKSRKEIQCGLSQAVIKQLYKIFERHTEISRVILYGSRATGHYRPSSDIDLCIESSELALFGLLRLEEEIDDLWLPWKVDLTLKRKRINFAFKHKLASYDLRQQIDQLGIVFYDRTELS